MQSACPVPFLSLDNQREDGQSPLYGACTCGISIHSKLSPDSPAEIEEVLGGYWVIDVRSREEAIEWARRCPAGENDVIEVRRVLEMSDLPEHVQKVVEGFSELKD
ncbi:YciI family protein [Mesorhizobium tamadayense]|uniref:YciI family protein n=1 Tax=Mesorhizobium tamadayense TaxID=425306 RepID=UPI003CCB01C4